VVFGDFLSSLSLYFLLQEVYLCNRFLFGKHGRFGEFKRQSILREEKWTGKSMVACQLVVVNRGDQVVLREKHAQAEHGNA
jgi:hypothetical protein